MVEPRRAEVVHFGRENVARHVYGLKKNPTYSKMTRSNSYDIADLFLRGLSQMPDERRFDFQAEFTGLEAGRRRVLAMPDVAVSELRENSVDYATVALLEDSGVVFSLSPGGLDRTRENLASDATALYDELEAFQSYIRYLRSDEAPRNLRRFRRGADYLSPRATYIQGKLATHWPVLIPDADTAPPDLDLKEYLEGQAAVKANLLSMKLQDAVWDYGLIGFNTLKDVLDDFARSFRPLRIQQDWQ